MTNPPPGPPYPDGHNPSQWAPPNQSPPTARIPSQVPPNAGPTERIARQAPPAEPPTRHIPSTPVPAAQPQSYPAARPAEEESAVRRFLKDPLSIGLILVIVCALGIAALLGGELYARSRANSEVAKVVGCVVQDKADASFGVVPPFLWQHLNKHYTNISIESAGNQVREAKDMKVNIDLKDVRLQNSANSAGTIGSLVAKINWTADGIKRTVQDSIPLFGGIVSGVTTHSSDGTIELVGPLGTVTARPLVADGSLSLQVLKVTGLGFTLPSESVQPAMDAFTAQLTKNYPMNIKADSVQVTDDGVTSQFSTQNATIPLDDDDPCFGGL